MTRVERLTFDPLLESEEGTGGISENPRSDKQKEDSLVVRDDGTPVTVLLQPKCQGDVGLDVSSGTNGQHAKVSRSDLLGGPLLQLLRDVDDVRDVALGSLSTCQSSVQDARERGLVERRLT